ncbi:hypothetical protein [Streptomyces tagetis]|uniref:Uncharacterized protein n=1 Tax=Streptomyces tagetis TaxID=2820809 RepID=A0A940XK37_9ACTN|nr:hypothetical protein [Streptomyces sp. RG38]MBQ0825278.1 hypothetical protein [Streptomyces sp. RG38]
MTLPTPYRLAAGLIYLSVGSLVGLLLVPLLAASLALRAVSWFLLVGLPTAVVVAVRGAAAVVRWAVPAARRRPSGTDHTLGEVLRQVPARMAVLRDGMSFSLPLLRALADLERLLAHSVSGDPGDPSHRSAEADREVEREHRSAEVGWDDVGYLGLLLLGTVWLLPLAALALPVVTFAVALPIGPPEQLAFGPGVTLLVTGTVTRVSVAVASVALFSVLLGLLFWMGKLRARVVRRILSRIDEAEAQRREQAAERKRIAALRVNDADYRRLERDLHDVTAGASDSFQTKYHMYVTTTGSIPTQPNVNWDSPVQAKLRCDAELATPGCVIPERRATLEYSLSDPNHGAAAAAYGFAQANLRGWAPLSRADGLNDANRARTCGAQSSDPFALLPQYVPDDSCDEFPFAGSFEGGTDGALCADILPLFQNGQWMLYEARTDKPVTFNEPCVRAHVALPANQSAGGKYGAFVKSQRVLDTEKYNVNVVA